ncbi:hypothetical protein BGX33_012060 [Mortierella sp. NVP41]|nr:hypothetical protein BGX33_012060 [Mortierella sp. NVP41]
MGNDSALTMESDRFLSTRNLVSPAPSVPVSSKVGTEFHSVSLSSPKDERSLPLIISPYAPSSSHNSSSFSVAGTDSTERGSNSPWNSYKSKGAKSEMSLPESERLSKTVADMQYGYYVKTLQHNKQYEKRRSDLSRQQPNNGLNRNITLNQYAILKDNSHDDVDLATAVLNLKDVELGEESIMIPLQTLETGTILVSSHLDLEQAGLQSPSANGPAPLMPMRSIPLRNNNAPAKTELNENEDEDEEIYTPGVGGSITMLNALKAAKAAKAAQTAQAGRGSASSAGTGPGSGRGVMPPLSEELISEESEVLVDNRRSRRPQ